jgi:coenzyme F420-0:L-glutamate ligase
MIIRPIKTRVFKPNESLKRFIVAHVPRLTDGSILFVTSKIVALAEGRTAAFASPAEKDRIIKAESKQYIKTKWCYLTLRNGEWCANAGVDESNAEHGGLILLPTNPYRSAQALRAALKKHYRIRHLGVLITDSRTLPLKQGTTGVALGYAGFKGLRDYVGTADLFGRKFKMTKANVADALAAAGVLVMGEGREQAPLAVIDGALVQFTDRIHPEELRIDAANDLYRPLFLRLKPKRQT